MRRWAESGKNDCHAARPVGAQCLGDHPRASDQRRAVGIASGDHVEQLTRCGLAEGVDDLPTHADHDRGHPNNASCPRGCRVPGIGWQLFSNFRIVAGPGSVLDPDVILAGDPEPPPSLADAHTPPLSISTEHVGEHRHLATVALDMDTLHAAMGPGRGRAVGRRTLVGHEALALPLTRTRHTC